ncbi:DUF3617 domain-containing protein [Rivibacter subsaxonicus]|uniref:Uncharacterized protein DUF3617 n=1 Tax=Rivibacter subsaxonicus TaxID=457575 RepID=A0A4Q7W0Z1_9BURK|nr:DUF3617 family protein [Rivibacter subsaxonicus]RZU02505.1 uncharacterized protein DUF3617 [Rivibacter subsaxonicus]
MDKHSSWIAMAALLLSLAPTALAQAPNLRPGGWEQTLTISAGGGAQRVTKLKSCITKEDLASMRTFEKDENCKNQYTTRSAARIAGSQVCVHGGQQRKGEFDIQFQSPESYLMTAGSRVVGEPASEMRMEMKARWASPNCTGYDD